MNTVTCVICPKGCVITRQADGSFVGNKCERGIGYAVSELTNPVRMVTSTVKISGAKYPRVSVKSSAPFPKDKMREAVKLLDGICLKSPVKIGDIAMADVLGHKDLNFVVTRNL